MDALPENTVYIGRKPTMNYVAAVVGELGSGAGSVTIKARGKSISRAVDVAEIVRNRYVTDAEVREIRIATEKLPNEDGKLNPVSSIEILLSRSG